MKVMGIDPGINEASYAILDDDGALIEAGLIKNTYKTNGKVEKLKKAAVMCLEMRNKLIVLPEVDLTVIEASTASADGMKNYNTMCRMGLVSGCAFGACDSRYVEFVPPQTWKRTRDKAENHALYMENVSESERKKLQKYLKGIPKTKQHNVLDAYCMAVWAHENY